MIQNTQFLKCHCQLWYGPVGQIRLDIPCVSYYITNRSCFKDNQEGEAMKRIFGGVWLVSLITILAVIVLSASRPASVTAAPASKAKPAVQAKPAWQEDWEKTVAAAKKEGKVAVINRLPPNLREGLAAVFRDKYGIEIDW